MAQLRSLTLVRHAQSAGNVANDAALASGRHELDLAIRDIDAPLSPLGDSQARALRVPGQVALAWWRWARRRS